MKKILGLLVFASSFTLQTFSQSDDGFVTSHLSTSANDTVVNNIAAGIDAGFVKVQNGELKSIRDINNYYNVNIAMSSSISPSIMSSNGAPQFSSTFINTLNSEIQKIGNESTKVIDVRNGFLQLAESGTLNLDESRALALIDISFQKMIQNYTTDVFAYNNSRTNYRLGGPSAFNENSYMININNMKLPSWARCALGTFGGAILGGLGGVAAGAQVGAHVGAVIGGIFGVIGGAFSGAASSCFIAPCFSNIIKIA